MNTIMIKAKTSGDYFSKKVEYFEIHKNNSHIWNCTDSKLFLESNPKISFTEHEIKEICDILDKIFKVKFRDLSKITFFNWGFIWQISERGQRPQIYLPYDVDYQFDDTKAGGFIFESNNVNLKTESKHLDYGDLRDLFVGRKQPKLKLSKNGTKKIIVTQSLAVLHGCKEIEKIQTTNGGKHFVYVGIY